jgi:hypothetical protein
MAERSEARVLFSAAGALGSWFRIPLEAWMCVRVFLCCVVLCVGRGLALGRSPVQGVYQLSNRFISFRKINSEPEQVKRPNPWKRMMMTTTTTMIFIHFMTSINNWLNECFFILFCLHSLSTIFYFGLFYIYCLFNLTALTIPCTLGKGCTFLFRLNFDAS